MSQSQGQWFVLRTRLCQPYSCFKMSATRRVKYTVGGTHSAEPCMWQSVTAVMLEAEGCVGVGAVVCAARAMI